MCVRDFTQEIKEIFKIHHEDSSRNLWHIYMMCNFNLHRMTYAGMVKRSKSHFENCNNGPAEAPCRAITATFWPRARRPRGPNVKKIETHLHYTKITHRLSHKQNQKWIIRRQVVYHGPKRHKKNHWESLNLSCWYLILFYKLRIRPNLSDSSQCDVIHKP